MNPFLVWCTSAREGTRDIDRFQFKLFTLGRLSMTYKAEGVGSRLRPPKRTICETRWRGGTDETEMKRSQRRANISEVPKESKKAGRRRSSKDRGRNAYGVKEMNDDRTRRQGSPH